MINSQPPPCAEGIWAKDVDVRMVLTRSAEKVANAFFMIVSPYDYDVGESRGISIRTQGHGLRTPQCIVTIKFVFDKGFD